MHLLPRTVLLTAALCAVTGVATGPTATAAPDRSLPRPSSLHTVGVPALHAVAGTARRGQRPETTSSVRVDRTAGYALLGVTWRTGTGSPRVDVQVRTRSAGTWTSWTRLEVDPESDAESEPGSDAGSDAGSGSRAGTEPLWVGRADGVQARVTAPAGTAAPAGVRVALVDPGTDPTTSVARTSTARASTGSAPSATAGHQPFYTARPSMITRSQWGARPNTSCDSPRYGGTQLGLVLHHTAGSNRYTKSQSRSVVRGIQRYHMSGRGWCDIGYNFLVDRYGQTFQGRNGDLYHQVRGAHAGHRGVNTFATGVAMIGNLDTVRPTRSMRTATVRLMGWRIGTFYLAAKGGYTLDRHTLATISGHRDVHNRGFRPSTATACPGTYAYSWLVSRGGLRDAVATYTSDYRTPIKTKYAALGRALTGKVYVGEFVYAGGHLTRFANGDIYSLSRATGAHWVSGPVRTELAAMGGVGSLLGFPTSDLTPAGDNATQTFQRGTAYRVGDTAYGLTTGVDTKYRELGAYSSDLGAPTSRVSTTGTLDTATFEHGQITYDRTTGQATVTMS